MSNVVHFPSGGPGAANVLGHVGSRLLSRPPTHAHAVQFYDDEPFLFETVGFFLAAGIESGEFALLIATAEHTEGILNQMGNVARDRALDGGQLLLVDADAMLARFMRDGEPVEALFEAAVERLFDSLLNGKGASDTTAGPKARRVRAFGEMVDLLWKRGNPGAALRLEELWNGATSRYDLVLLCGYGMRNFYKAEDTVPFGEVCRLHTHVMPTEHFARDHGDLFERMREISVLEQRARSLQSEVAYREELEGALRARLGAGDRATPVAFGATPAAVITPGAGIAKAFSVLTGLRRRLAGSRQRLARPLVARLFVAARARLQR